MREIAISGIIGWDVVPQDLRKELDKANGGPVEIVINSPGGLVSDGIEMFNMLRNYKGETSARLSGYAMSMASYIPLACDSIVAEDNAVYMIHNVRGGVWGDHNEILKYGAYTQGLSRVLAKAYARRTGAGLDDICAQMDAETFFFGDEMVESGFVDSLVESQEETDKEAALSTARAAFESCHKTMASTDLAADLTKAAALAGCMEHKENKPRVPAQADPAEKGAQQMLTVEKLKAEHSDLVAAIVAEAQDGMISTDDLQQQVTTARAEGATAERERILSVEAQALPGHDDLVAELKADGKTTGPEAAVQILAAEKAANHGVARAMESGANQPVPAAEGGNGGNPVDPDAPIDERAKAEWSADKDLRAEFGGKFDSYLAWKKSDESGRSKVLGKK